MNRIKFLQDKRNNFRRISLNDDLCTIMKEPIGVIINPTDILQIHRIPRDHGKNWPVIANFKNVKIKYRAKLFYHSLNVIPNFFDDFSMITDLKCLVFQGENVQARPSRGSI